MARAFLYRLLAVVFGLFMAVEGYSQYGNEWIRFNQQYFKIPVAKDGIYRVSYSALQAAGFPIASDPIRIQLWHRGVQVARHVESGQYIEFYGQKNNGVGDSPLYKPSSVQPHQYYNLFSDTTAYFLTVNTAGGLGIPLSEYTENNNTSIPAETYHNNERLILFTKDYASGVRYFESGSTSIQNTFFDKGEGWTDFSIAQGNVRDTLIQNLTSRASSSGVNPQLEIQLVGRTRGSHPYEISVGPLSPSRVIASGSFSEYGVVTLKNIPLNWTDFSADGKLFVRVNALTTGGSSYRLSVSYIKIVFPQDYNMEDSSNKSFYLNENAANKSFIQIQNVPTGVSLFDITDPNDPIRVGATLATTLNAVVNNTNVSRVMFATKNFISPEVKKISFRQIAASNPDYIIVSHPTLMKPAGGYTNAVKEYAGYRASVEGGSYDTLLLDIHQLYNQFNYGEISPLAITRLMEYLLDQTEPKYLFLIGRGLEVSYGYHRKAASTFNGFHDLIPSAGAPSSDMAFTAGIGSTPYEPAVPTGRISATTPQQVVDYFEKVKEMEAKPYDNLWRKEVLHLSGGITTVEQGFFKNIMKAIGLYANGFYLGGKVTSIAKNTPEIEFINISDKVNSGVNLVTLFGHSTSSTNDFNIGFASAPELGYNNGGKYPMLLLNGCNAGNFFDPAVRYGEDWILTPGKGALGFMANASFGYTDVLSYYTSTFYKVAYRDSTFIHRGVGDIQKEVVKRMINGLNEESDTIRYSSQALQMFLLGDPAVRVFGASKPDYEINNDHVYEESLNGEPITSFSDSFALKLIVRNFGRAKEDSITVRVIQTLADNTTIQYDSVFSPVSFSDTLTFKILKNEKGFGVNDFDIEIDASHTIHEYNESNNTAHFEFLIPLNATKNLYPQNFGIVNTPTVNLVVQSTDMLGEERGFIIQVDTVNTFDSPYLKEFTMNGTVAMQNIELLSEFDTLAYYWNSRFAEIQPGESEDSVVTSFTFIKDGPEGWAQVHFPQFFSNELNNLGLDAAGRKFNLNETVTDVSVTTFGVNASGYQLDPFSQTYYFHPGASVMLGGTEYHPISLINSTAIAPCQKNTINLIAFNKTTTTPYFPYFEFASRSCGRRPEVIGSFLLSETDLYLTEYIQNVNEGDSVILFSIGNPGYSAYSSNVKNKLAELGISLTQINQLMEDDSIATVIFAKKGAAPGTAIIQRATSNDQMLQAVGTITGRFTSGTMTSPVIGPAVDWKTLFTKVVLTELPQTDEFTFDVRGVTITGQESILKTGLTNIAVDISDIDAEQYPYLKLEYHATDEINLTPPQLSKWIVTYTHAAEGVLVFNGSTAQQNLREGEIWSESFGFRNISQKEFPDSLTVHYTFQNTTFRTSSPYSKRIKAPLPGTQTDFELSANTIGKAGLNNVRVFVNPRILPELYYDNNVIDFKNYLNVIQDIYNPVMDVTIDGRYILDGDYVSSNPMINVKLWDENSLILKTDTLGVNVFLKYPCETESCPFKAIYFTRSDVQWFAATASSDFRVEFNPQNLQPGVYTLQVQARDSRNNSSGVVPYEVNFVVADDNTISLQKPYPNPSSSVFFFPVVVTGDIQPDALQLQIISSNGRIVGEFFKTDFFTGTNLISWESADASGNQLPSGLYLYRAVLIREGREIKTTTGKLMLQRE